MRLILLFLLFFPLLSFAQGSPRVINGVDAEEGQFPWMVSLIERNADPALDIINCGGTLVHERYVLTAAHCVHSFFGEVASPRRFQVLVGRTTLSSDVGSLFSLRAVISHPDYNDSRFVPLGDLALLHLTEASDKTLVSLASSSDEGYLDGDLSATVLGWGIANADALEVYPDTLQVGTMSILSDATCRDEYGLIFNSETMVCAAKLSSDEDLQDGVDTCFGDSGGPLLSDGGSGVKQVGITSFGFRCEDTQFPGGYTEVPVYLDWINGVIDAGVETETLLNRVTRLVRKLGKGRAAKVARSRKKELSQSLARLRELARSSNRYAVASFSKLTPFAVKKLSRLSRAATASSNSSTSRARAKRKALSLLSSILA